MGVLLSLSAALLLSGLVALLARLLGSLLGLLSSALL